MRFIGVLIPALALACCVTLLAIAGGFFYRGRRRVRISAALIGGVLLLAMLAALPGAVSTHLGYAVPWRLTPYEVNVRGREYHHHGCERPRGRQTRVGWVYGYFTLWRPLSASARVAHRGANPTILLLGGGTSSCEPVYAVTGRR